MRTRTRTELARCHLPHLSLALAAVILTCVVVGLGLKEAVGDGDAWAALQGGGAFVLMRHGTAERRNDPRNLSPGNCALERNLSDKGREEAALVGEAFRRRGIAVTAVLASPYCRTLDTARLAFGSATSWKPLTLIAGVPEETAKEWTETVEQRIRQGAGSSNVIMVSHRPNIEELTKESLAPAEALVIKADQDGGLVVIGRVGPVRAP